jgi:hypothetical protein
MSGQDKLAIKGIHLFVVSHQAQDESETHREHSGVEQLV